MSSPAHAALAGDENIVVDVRRHVPSITLNADGLSVTAATIDGNPAAVSFNGPLQQATFVAAAGLDPGRHVLALHFARSGSASNQYGMMETHPGRMSLFESSLARTVFPCFDEPEFRARFSVHVQTPKGPTVISNMPVTARQRLDDGNVRWNFAQTPPMPVYLLTVDIGPFVAVQGTADGIPIAVWTRPEDAAHARTVLQDAERFLPFYHTFFGIPYPLPKLDIVVGRLGTQTALEGWGAINIYSSYEAFGGQFGGGIAGRRDAAQVLAHEMAHQWVGDLVTMRWWRDTFVAEGLAEFAQRQAMQRVYPSLASWRSDEYDIATLMDTPVGPQMGPALVDVKTDLESDAENAFTSATYTKGASILDGWHEFVGDARFHRRLTGYLRTFAYRSATYEDFWRAMGGATGVHYGLAWLAQRGHPVVSVDWHCHANQTSISLAQEPFVADRSVQPSYRRQRWPIPLTVALDRRTTALLFEGRRSVLTVRGCGIPRFDTWATQYYRLRYPRKHYAEVARNLKAATERERDRFYMDTAALTATGYLDDGTFVKTFAVKPNIDPELYA
ncbi:MAG TPA: M1 family metallopeptidase, partial [Candidatus Aquilonibacter sp.]|nr:M1 family metallopeptidase [Candidatus Aquilonibacter sp.]